MTAVRIVIAEDDQVVAQHLRQALVRSGFEIAGVATTGEEAIGLTRKERPDLILMDISLSGSPDGITAAEEIRKFSPVPVVYLAPPVVDTAVLEKAVATEPYGFVTKPVREGEIRTTVELALHRSKNDLNLRESEEKFRSLAENTADVLLALDIDGIVTYVSPQVNKYGYLEEDLLSHPFLDFIYVSDRRKAAENFRMEIDAEREKSSAFRIVDKWGYLHWVENHGTIRVDVYGKPVGLYGVLLDITDRRRAEEGVKLANKKLNLLNNITRHDILNTITGLLGLVDMATSTEIKKDRDELLAQIRMLVRVIERQITFTREYQEVGVNEPIWQDFDAIMERVVANFSHAKLRFVVDIRNLEIFADPLLEKVFYNLIDNAIRYGEKISTITFYCQISDKGLALISEDDGVGVPPNAKEQIFERGIGKNTGMGLFLTREILTITGITIREIGTYPQGARFELLIPNGAWRFRR